MYVINVLNVLLTTLHFELTGASYTMVTSVSTCVRVTSKAECEEAAHQLGLSDTTATGERESDWPPYCYLDWEDDLWFNRNGNSEAPCLSDEVCICKSNIGEVNCY